jgi:hypothetical protein
MQKPLLRGLEKGLLHAAATFGGLEPRQDMAQPTEVGTGETALDAAAAIVSAASWRWDPSAISPIPRFFGDAMHSLSCAEN